MNNSMQTEVTVQISLNSELVELDKAIKHLRKSQAILEKHIDHVALKECENMKCYAHVLIELHRCKNVIGKKLLVMHWLFHELIQDEIKNSLHMKMH